MQALALVLKAYCFLISILHKAYSGGMIILPHPPPLPQKKKKKKIEVFSNAFNLCFSQRESVGALMIIAVIFGVWAW